MALEMQDLMALKSMGGKEMTPYEQYMVSHKESKKPSGVAIAGLTVGSVAAAAAVTAWIFGGTYANAKSKEAKEAAQSAKEVAMAYYAGVDKRLDNIGALLESEDPKAPWTREQWKSAMESFGLPLEEQPCYNKCALYVTMSMIMSDSSKTLSKYAADSNAMFEFVHALALDKLKDVDKRFDIRHYFNL